MTLHVSSLFVFDPEDCKELAFNQLVNAIETRGETTLTVRWTPDSNPFPLVVSEVTRFRLQTTGIVTFQALTPLGNVTGRIRSVSQKGSPVGKITIATEGVPDVYDHGGS